MQQDVQLLQCMMHYSPACTEKACKIFLPLRQARSLPKVEAKIDAGSHSHIMTHLARPRNTR